MNHVLFFLLWGLVTCAVFVSAAAGSLLAGYLSWKRKRAGFLIPMGVFALLSALSLIANPIANLLLFNRSTESTVAALHEDMTKWYAEDADVQRFQNRFGMADQSMEAGEREYWIYKPNPWWKLSWSNVGVSVQEGRIVGVYFDD